MGGGGPRAGDQLLRTIISCQGKSGLLSGNDRSEVCSDEGLQEPMQGVRAGHQMPHEIEKQPLVPSMPRDHGHQLVPVSVKKGLSWLPHIALPVAPLSTLALEVLKRTGPGRRSKRNITALHLSCHRLHDDSGPQLGKFQTAVQYGARSYTGQGSFASEISVFVSKASWRTRAMEV